MVTMNEPAIEFEDVEAATPCPNVVEDETRTAREKKRPPSAHKKSVFGSLSSRLSILGGSEGEKAVIRSPITQHQQEVLIPCQTPCRPSRIVSAKTYYKMRY